MAIAYGRMTVISRSNGGNAVRSAAYQMRENLTCERTGETFRYAGHENDLVHHEILLPAGASSELMDAEKLWNSAQAMERRKDSQEAKSLILALPKELDTAAQVGLARSFVQEHFVDKGLAAQIDLHDKGDGQPHAHVLISTRRIDEDGFSLSKARDLNPQMANNRVVNNQDWGGQWTAHQNTYFEKHDLDIRVDPIAAKPGEHLGAKAHFIGTAQEEVIRLRETNAELCRDPERVLEALTRNNATFTARDVSRYMEKHASQEDDAAALKAAVMQHESVLKLYDPETGDFSRRYTTTEVRQQELQAISDAATIAARKHALHPEAIASAEDGRGLRPDQAAAYHRATEGPDLVIIEGRAGTGKSYTAQRIREAHELDDRRVIGLAPTNKVAVDLAGDGFGEARTVHSLLFRLEHEKDHLTRRTVLIVDEAAMVDSKVLGKLLHRVEEAGSKVVLIGDDRQLSSIERGGLFTELRERHGSAEISQVTRQRVEWQRNAAEDLAAGRFDLALKAFNDHGAVHWAESKAQAMRELTNRWRLDTAVQTEKTTFVLAYTNADVDHLNREIRQIRLNRHEIEAGYRIETKHGEFEFSVGDRIQFTGTDKGIGFVNGNTATILAIKAEDQSITARLDNGKVVSWKPDQINEHGEMTGQSFRLGYAGTVYKAQGATIDRTYLFHSEHWRSASSYVALTRQREGATLFVSREVARDLPELTRQMSRTEDRRASIAYAVKEEVAMARPEMQTRQQAQKAVQEVQQQRIGRVCWQIAPSVAGSDEDSLGRRIDAASRAREREEGTAKERAEMYGSLKEIYRDPEKAAEAIRGLIAQGHDHACRVIRERPDAAGQLHGRDGWFSTRKQQETLREATEKAGRLASKIGQLGDLGDQIEKQYVKTVTDQQQRDTVGIPALSRHAEKASADLSAAQDKVRAWNRIDPEVRHELVRYKEAVCQRYPGGMLMQAESARLREAGMDPGEIVGIQTTAQAVRQVESAIERQQQQMRERNEEKISQGQRQSRGTRQRI